MIISSAASQRISLLWVLVSAWLARTMANYGSGGLAHSPLHHIKLHRLAMHLVNIS